MEQMEPVIKRANNGQLNLNTVLLAICMGLSGWVLFSINQLDEKIAGMMPLINVNSSAIEGINRVNEDHTKKIDELSIRLTKLETIESDQFRKQN